MVYIMSNAPCKGNTLIIRLLPLQGVRRCGDIIFTQGAALGYVLLGFLALASGKAERSPSLTTLLVLPDSNSFLYFRSKTSRKVIVTRTESDRTADAI